MKDFGGGSLQQIMKKMNQVQNQMKKVQESFSQKTYEGTAGGGAVKATVQGRDKIVSFKINPELLSSEEKEMLEDMLIVATNDALSQAQDAYNTEIEKITGPLPLPSIY